MDIEITDNSPEVLDEFTRREEAALEAIGSQCANYARLGTPVDTGTLRNSFTHVVEMEDDSVSVGTNVSYGPYVEFGTGIYATEGGRQTPWVYQDEKGNWHYTHGSKPHHMLQHAVEDHKEEYRRIAETQFKG